MEKARIEKNGYSECECGGLIAYRDSEWLGENENSIGRTRVWEQCEKCGHFFTGIITG